MGRLQLRSWVEHRPRLTCVWRVGWPAVLKHSSCLAVRRGSSIQSLRLVRYDRQSVRLPLGTHWAFTTLHHVVSITARRAFEDTAPLLQLAIDSLVFARVVVVCVRKALLGGGAGGGAAAASLATLAGGWLFHLLHVALLHSDVQVHGEAAARFVELFRMAQLSAGDGAPGAQWSAPGCGGDVSVAGGKSSAGAGAGAGGDGDAGADAGDNAGDDAGVSGGGSDGMGAAGHHLSTAVGENAAYSVARLVCEQFSHSFGAAPAATSIAFLLRQELPYVRCRVQHMSCVVSGVACVLCGVCA